MDLKPWEYIFEMFNYKTRQKKTIFSKLQTLTPPLIFLYDVYCTNNTRRRKKYSNVLQAHIVIVGQVRILLFLFRYFQTICRRLGDAISKFGENQPTQHRIFQKHVRNISNLSLQLKYCRNIFVNYSKIFHCNITILTF